MNDVSTIKALTFDVFGTVVDWRGSIINEGEARNAMLQQPVDWGALADAWRAQYRPMMDRVQEGDLPWTPLDRLHRMILDQLLPQFGIHGWTEAQIADFNRVWHRLEPWPDARAGLQRLRTRFVVATLSNGNLALLTNMAKHAELPWDCILSVELAQRYKPDPAVYHTTATLLDLDPAQIMMVAAHQDDLHAAHGIGMRTAFVPRPMEHGAGKTPDLTPDSSFDMVAADFIDLAVQLGC